MHVTIELTSDIKEFNTGLVKLKNNELKSSSNQHQLRPSLKNSTENLASSQPISSEFSSSNPKQTNVLGSHSMPLMDKPHIEKPFFSHTIQCNQTPAPKSEEFSLPIQMYMSISEGRGFVLAPNTELSTIYLICRLFWCREKVKFEAAVNRTSTQFSWTLNLSLLLNPSLIENMRNNFMIIEAWQKASPDALVGTIKLPLHEFYLRFSDMKSVKEFLADSSVQPVIGIDGWLSSLDPFTGRKSGELNILLAMGSNDHILNLQKYLFDKARIKFNAIASSGGLVLPVATASNQTPVASRNSKKLEHCFTINVDNIKVHPVRSALNRSNEIVLDETDYFIKYFFPSFNSDQNSHSFKQYVASTRLNTNFNSKQEHRLVFDQAQSIKTELASLFEKCGGKLAFEVWSKSYFPNLREKLIGNGELLVEKLTCIVENANESGLNFNNRSFIVPLVQVDEFDSCVNTYQDKYCGQVFLTIDYKRDELSSIVTNLPASITKSNSSSNNNLEIEDTNGVCLNVGILRANGLKSTIRALISKNNNTSTSAFFTLEESKVYVKFSLNFLNQAQVNIKVFLLFVFYFTFINNQLKNRTTNKRSKFRTAQATVFPSFLTISILNVRLFRIISRAQSEQ